MRPAPPFRPEYVRAVTGHAPTGRGAAPRTPLRCLLIGGRALDRDSVVPLYFQLGAVLKEMVETGAWQPGARFPTEREIGGRVRCLTRP